MSPAMTRVSLLASAMSIPCSIAFKVGFSPIFPETATRIMSFSVFEHISSSPSEPYRIFVSSMSIFSFVSLPIQIYLV